ncbi:MAG: hypothetical protein ACI87A_003808 [Planctomycetota bacterium]
MPDANAKEVSEPEESEQDSMLSKPVVKAVETPASTKPSEQSLNRSESANWGDLPRHAQRVFRAEGDGEIPAQYRDWIDAYYRKLNSDRR